MSLRRDSLARRKSGRLTSGSGSSVWPTARVSRGAYQRDGGDPEKDRLTLTGVAQCLRCNVTQGRGIHKKKPRIDRSSGSFVPSKRPLLSHSGRGTHTKRPRLAERSTPGVHRQLPSLYGNKGCQTNVGWTTAWMSELSDRLRGTRVCCGDWKRVVTASVTWKIGGGMLTGVFLDPPYDLRVVSEGRDGAAPSDSLYSEYSPEVSTAVRDWAVENGDNPLLLIALCGYEGEHNMPADWECVPWKTNGGYRNRTEGNESASRERIWFSPHCLKAQQGALDFHADPQEVTV